MHACLRAGLRYTPVNWHLTADEVAYIVGDSRAKALFGDARFGELMTSAAALSPDATARLAIGGEIAGFESYDAALAEQDDADIPDPQAGFRMLYTSGTTGKPKGVVRPLNYSTGLTGLTSAPQYGPGKGQLNLCTGPMHHGGPLVYSMAVPISQGVGTVLMDRWDAAEALRLIEKHRITHTHMVPTMFHRLLRLPEAAVAAPTSLRCSTSRMARHPARSAPRRGCSIGSVRSSGSTTPRPKAEARRWGPSNGSRSRARSANRSPRITFRFWTTTATPAHPITPAPSS